MRTNYLPITSSAHNTLHLQLKLFIYIPPILLHISVQLYASHSSRKCCTKRVPLKRLVQVLCQAAMPPKIYKTHRTLLLKGEVTVGKTAVTFLTPLKWCLDSQAGPSHSCSSVVQINQLITERLPASEQIIVWIQEALDGQEAYSHWCVQLVWLSSLVFFMYLKNLVSALRTKTKLRKDLKKKRKDLLSPLSGDKRTTTSWLLKSRWKLWGLQTGAACAWNLDIIPEKVLE